MLWWHLSVPTLLDCKMAKLTPKQEGIKKLQEEITCPLCLDDFDDPKRLPCGHIYCKVPCLQGLLLRSMNSTVTCPECRSATQIPANGIDNFPNAFQVNRLKQVYLELSKEAVTTHASPQGMSHPCPNHPSQPQDLYCETCKVLICRDCIVVAHQHQEHKYGLVKNVAAEQKEAVLQELVPIETFAQQATDAIAKIEEEKGKIVSQKEDLTQQITVSFNALQHFLEEQKQALLVCLQEQTDLKQATIETQQQEIETASSKLQQVIDSVSTTATQDYDDYEFLSKKPQLTAKITEVTYTFSQISLNPAVEPDLVARVLPLADLQQVSVSTNYVRKGIPDPQRCSVKGDGLTGTEIDTPTTFTVNIVNEHGIPCSGKVSVELKALRNGTITQPQVTACSPSQYKVSYIPTVRGKHELSIKVNGEHITDSPFKVFVQIPISKIKGPVAEITDLISPGGLHSAIEGILACDGVRGEVAMYDHSLKRVASFREGSHFLLKKLKGPNEITTDSQLNIYITTCEDTSLHKFTKDGTHVKTVTGTGHKGGQFSFPNGLCIFDNQLLYVCDTNNGKVLVFDVNLKYLSEVAGCYVYPTDLDVDTSGRLYICDRLTRVSGGHIKVLAPNGTHLYTVSHQLMSRPVTIRIFGELMFVSDYESECVVCFTLFGEYIGSFGQEYLKFPEGVAIDEDGFFYVSSKRQQIILVF